MIDPDDSLCERAMDAMRCQQLAISCYILEAVMRE
jgi:hypothetical protein